MFAMKVWLTLVAVLVASLNTRAQDVPKLLRQAETQWAAGQAQAAVALWEQAVALAERSGDRSQLLLAKSSVGGACACLKQRVWAERQLREALELAGDLGDEAAAARARVGLGNSLAARGKIAEALAQYEKAAADLVSGPVALVNGAAVAGSREWSVRARAAVAEMARKSGNDVRGASGGGASGGGPSGGGASVSASGDPAAASRGRSAHQLARLWLRSAETEIRLGALGEAEVAAGAALALAEELGDARLRSFAVGQLGRVAELRGDLPGAEDWTEQALFWAQAAQAPESSYRWHWQLGRLWRMRGRPEQARLALARAAATLRPIQADLLAGCGFSVGSFRESVGGLYYDWADLILQQAQSEADLRAACEVIEQFKSAELDDYLEDACAARAPVAPAWERLAAETAVLYVVPLAERTELIVGLPTGLQRRTVPVGAGELEATVRRWRGLLEKRTTREHAEPGRQLYGWLVEPVRELLVAGGVKTVVFATDGVLRTVPLGALHDGQSYLVEQYAVAVSPGLTVLESGRGGARRGHALAGGMSAGAPPYAPLPHVTNELAVVRELFAAEVRLNEQFVLPALARDFAARQYAVVHLASHGEFRRDLAESYLVLHDGKLSLDELEQLVRPTRYRGRPLELLTLSGCATAAGDDRAALGLAGVAVKAGARSVLGALWYVQDESTAQVMTEFYRHWCRQPMGTKAAALQAAQVALLRGRKYEHPGYWAPYVLVGNWM